MATYTITSSMDANPDIQPTFKYRYRSRDGFPLAQEEFDRRRDANKPAVMWRWMDGKATMVASHLPTRK